MKSSTTDQVAAADINLDKSFGSRLEFRQVLSTVGRAESPPCRKGRISIDAQAYDDIFQKITRSSGEMQKRLHLERRAAGELWVALEAHPQARRRLMVRNDRRFQTWGLYQCLLERYRVLADQQPLEAAAAAELALEVARSLDPAEHGEARTADFQAGALAAVGDARRRLSDLQGAREALEQAWESLESGTGDPLEEAELEHLWGQLQQELGATEEAERAFRRAGTLYRRIGDPRLQPGFSGDPEHEHVRRRHSQSR